MATPLILSYPTFTSGSGFAFNFNASYTSNKLRLTPETPGQRGSVWYATPLTDVGATTTFTTHFVFIAGKTFEHGTADGFTFAIHADPLGTAACGQGGGNLGLGATSAPLTDSISPSWALGFNCYKSGAELYANSVYPWIDGAPTGAGTAEEIATTINDYTPRHCWIDVYGGYARIYLATTGTKPSTPILTTAIDLSAIGSTCYVGFTGACGGSYQEHSILSWDFAAANGALLYQIARAAEVVTPRTAAPSFKYFMDAAPLAVTPSTLSVGPAQIKPAVLDGIVVSGDVGVTLRYPVGMIPSLWSIRAPSLHTTNAEPSLHIVRVDSDHPFIVDGIGTWQL